MSNQNKNLSMFSIEKQNKTEDYNDFLLQKLKLRMSEEGEKMFLPQVQIKLKKRKFSLDTQFKIVWAL